MRSLLSLRLNLFETTTDTKLSVVLICTGNETIRVITMGLTFAPLFYNILQPKSFEICGSNGGWCSQVLPRPVCVL
jgi:hypothetical protein